jgi:hypothetical protein
MSLVGIAMGYWLGRLWNRGSVPGRGKRFIFAQESRQILSPIQSLIQWIRTAPLPELMRLRHEAHKSPPSSVEVQMCGPISPLPIHIL